MKEYSITYVLTTFNKLSYLKKVVGSLIDNLKEDEELIISDGGSKDGTPEYLAELHQQGRIHHFISAPDKGEAHGFNKAILLAKGKIIKVVTDDDVFHWDLIRQCKDYLLANDDVDVIGFDGMACNISATEYSFKTYNTLGDFHKWKKDGTPFFYCGLAIMFKRSALSYLGLLNTNFIIVDLEYSLRITHMKAKIAWCTGIGFVNIVNSNSNSTRHWKRLWFEKEKVERFYLNKKVLISKKYIFPVIEFLSAVKKKVTKAKPKVDHDYDQVYQEAKQRLYEVQQRTEVKFYK